MLDLSKSNDHLEWKDIEPYIARLYKRYFAPEFDVWSEEIWSRLRQFDLTRADSKLNAIDSFTRAINLFDLHRNVVYYLGNVDLDKSMDGSLISIVTIAELKELAVIRYRLSRNDTLMMDESLSSATGALYMCQVPSAIQALYCSYGSDSRMHQRILELSGPPRRSGNRSSRAYTGAAVDYIRRIAYADGVSDRIYTIHASETAH